MNIKKLSRFLNRNEILIIVIALGLAFVFGIIDSFISAYFFKQSDLVGQLLITDSNIIWKRSLVLIIFLINGIIIIKMLRYNQRAAEKLYESQEIFKNVFENTSSGIALADADGNFIRVNSSFTSLLGFREEELLQKNFRDITHPEDLEADVTMLNQLKEDKISNFSMEKRYRHKNGHYIWILLNVSSIRNTSGEQQFYIAHIQNISDRRESSFIDISEREKAVFEKNRAFVDVNQIFNSIGIGMCLIDMNHNIARINDAFLKLFQKEREDVIGHKCIEVMHEEICMTDDCPLNLILSGESCEFESYKRIGENKVATFIVTANPFLAPNGDVQGVILSFTDITEIRILEKTITDISEQERQNLGQLLHDELGQLLTGLAFRTEALLSIMEEKSYPEVKDAQEISGLIKNINSHIRRIMIGLYPVNVKYDRLLVALKDLASETRRVFGLKCQVITEGDVKITNYTDITQLLYIAKESVQNALKHAGAKKISIILSERDNVFSMLIQNDGKIKTDFKNKTGGLGLRIMEYRAKLIGAKFDYWIDNNSFKVRVRKPITGAVHPE